MIGNWVMLYFKRLLKRKSYIFFLCTVIGIVFISNSLSDNENSALKIALCQEDSSSVSDKAIKFLLDKNTIMKYLYYENISDAEKAVENHKVDAVWIFRADPVKRISGYVSKKSTEPFIRIIEREENTLLRMEREALISSVFEEVSFWILNNCAGKNSFDEAELRKIYAKHRGDNNFIEIQKLNTQKSDEEKNLIFSPMKGICALVVLFAGLDDAAEVVDLPWGAATAVYGWGPDAFNQKELLAKIRKNLPSGYYVFSWEESLYKIVKGWCHGNRVHLICWKNNLKQ